jgi:cytoskeletal protein CcmA (bactofilin family)
MLWEKKPRLAAAPVTVPPKPMQTDMPMPETASRIPTPALSNSPHTVVGQSIVLQGKLAGSEDLLIEGQFEGTITLEENCVTVGPEGQVKAEIRARQVVILGMVTGNITAREKVEVRRSGRVVGDLLAGAIVIEEGAYLKGSIDILREEAGEGPRAMATSSTTRGNK